MRTQFTLAAACLFAASAFGQKIEPSGPPADWPANGEDHYPNYRDQVRRALFVPLPSQAVTPRGWLKNQIDLKAAAALGAAANPEWLRAAGDLARLVGNDALQREVTAKIAAVIKEGKPTDPVPAADALMAHFDATGDKKILDVLSQHFRRIAALSDDKKLLEAAGGPPADLLPQLFWLHARTGQGELIELAERLRKLGPSWALGVPPLDTLDLARGFRGPLHAWQFTGQQRFRDQSDRAFDMLSESCGRFPGGGFVRGDPSKEPPPDDARAELPAAAAVELLNSYLLMARVTGDAKWLDRAEEIAFNTLPALDAPVLGTSANRIEAKAGPVSFRGWPLFARHAVTATSDSGLAVLLYSPVEVTAKAGTGDVKLEVMTDYPFGDDAEVRVTCTEANDFPLYLRGPEWADNCQVSVRWQRHKLEPHQYAKLGPWPKGTTTVRVKFNPHVRVHEWEEHKQCVSVYRGPLAFSVNIGMNRTASGAVAAATPWNYALLYADADPPDSFAVQRRPLPKAGTAFTPTDAPLELSVLAKRVPGWKADGDRPGPLQDSPARTSEPVETIRLIPMGAARLRMTVLPRASDNADAHEWK